VKGPELLNKYIESPCLRQSLNTTNFRAAGLPALFTERKRRRMKVHVLFLDDAAAAA
jgi:hypothetical protein